MTDTSRALEAHGYLKADQIGQGSFGIVYRGVHVATGQEVAMKKMKMSALKDGIDFTAIREIKILKLLHSEYFVNLVDVFIHRRDTHNNLWLISELMSTDLETIINDRSIPISASDIKTYLFRLLKGVAFLSSNWVIHRDLKPANLLISAQGEMKIADFGLAKSFGRDIPATPNVVTRWYRAPELLFGARYYGSAVDIWSVGCIFAELLLRNPFFPGDNEIDQLAKIFAALGTPREDQWPGMKSLPTFIEFTESAGTPFELMFVGATTETLDLLSHLLLFDPLKRPTAEKALTHAYFTTGPVMTPTNKLPLPSRVKQKRQPEPQDTERRVRPRLDGGSSAVRQLEFSNLDTSINSSFSREEVQVKMEVDV